VHGTPTLSLRRHVFADFRLGGAVDSWFADAHVNGTDTQCWLLLSGGRNQLYRNNYCSAGHEHFLAGGGDPADSTLQPSDVILRGNHFHRPIAWKGKWQSKNMIEAKNVRRVLIEGNVGENSWPDAQSGFCVVMKGENQDGTAPWSTSADITFRYNVIKNCANGFNISGRGTAGPVTNASSRFSIHDNLIDSVGKHGGDGIAIQSLNDVTDSRYERNTFRNGLQGSYSNQAISFDGTPAVRFHADSNVIGHGAYGVKGAGQGDGVTTLNAFAPGASFTYNAIVGGCGSYPATNTCPTTLSGVMAGIGANLARITTMTAGVVVTDPAMLRPRVPRASETGWRASPDVCHRAGASPLAAAKCDVPLKRQ
jgi:hypothetical protein